MIPKVSIIVPCWGVEKFLNQAVGSLVSQTLREIEIILVDDESPDRVPQMCDEWALKDPRIKVVHKKNAGLGMACNSGIEVATGEYVTFCDSDDWVEFKTYETLYAKAKDNNADLVMTSLKYVNLEGESLPKESMSYTERLYIGDDIKQIMKGIIASSPSCIEERQFQASAKVTLYRHEIIKLNQLKFVSERVMPSEDLLFNLDFLSYSSKVLLLPEKFYNYRVNPNSITHNVKQDAYAISKQLYYFLMNKVKELELGEDGIHRVQRMFIGTTRATVSKIIRSKMHKEEIKILLDSICNDDTLKSVSKVYPIHLMPLKHKIFYLATIHNLQFALRLMTKYMH